MQNKNSSIFALLCFFPTVLYSPLPKTIAAEKVNFAEASEILKPVPAPKNGQKKVEIAKGIDGRVMAGYQGWFRAPGDGSGLRFHHYSKHGKFEPGSCTIDLWPDLTEFDEDEKFPTTFRHADGRTAHVFSSQNAKTVDRHFRWMQEYGIDGVFVQRFASVVTKSFSLLKADNQKLLNCRDAALNHGRCYALMYDLSGFHGTDFELLARDWKQLRTRMQIGTDSNDSSYLHLNGKPLVSIWGVGFNDDRSYSLQDAEKFIRLLKHNPEWGGMSIMLGVPYGWRDQDRDSTDDPQLHKVLELADVISPWTVGRYQEVDFPSGEYINNQIKDRNWCEERNITYLPVLFPGFSWFNLKGKDFDAIPRRKGGFLWNQFVGTRAAGNKAAYIAMFDEIDEGTAIFKCSNDVPVGEGVRFLDYEGLPSDHYLKLTGEGAKLLRGEMPTQ